MRITPFLLCLCLLIIPLKARSQQISRSVVSILGKGTAASTYFVNQTVGEAIACTYSSNLHILTQGFQQPSLISTWAPGENDLFDAIDVYPNPVTAASNHILTLTFRIDELPDYFLKIYDSRGRTIYFDEFKGLYSQDIQIDMSGFPQSIYFVHVFSGNRKMDRYFKIEKF